MKIDLGKLIDTFGSLMAFSAIDMPPALAIRVRRVVSVAKKEQESYQNVTHEAAAKFGGTLQQQGQISFYQFPTPEKKKEFTDLMAPARKTEVELPGDPLTEADINQLKEVKPGLLADLDWLITL